VRSDDQRDWKFWTKRLLVVGVIGWGIAALVYNAVNQISEDRRLVPILGISLGGILLFYGGLEARDRWQIWRWGPRGMSPKQRERQANVVPYKDLPRYKRFANQMLAYIIIVGVAAFAIYACDFRTGRDPYPLYCQDNPCD
jgi:uncharacterized membrane protein YbhN (UPF0104 family)